MFIKEQQGTKYFWNVNLQRDYEVGEKGPEALGCRLQRVAKGTIGRPGDMGQTRRLSQGVSCPDPCHLDLRASKTQAMAGRVPGSVFVYVPGAHTCF